MQAYPTSSPVNNPDLPPAVPALLWSYEQREAQFGPSNPSFKHGRGRGRRWRREVDTRGGCDRRAAILQERASFVGADGVMRTWRELVYTALDGRAPYLLALQARARKLMDEISAHGPASGWGIPQPIADAQGNPKWTPYVVPKRSEKCWRWWRGRRLDLAGVLKALGWLWGKPVPLHRAPTSNTSTAEQPETPPGSLSHHPTRYRDRSAEPWAAAAARITARLGM